MSSLGKKISKIKEFAERKQEVINEKQDIKNPIGIKTPLELGNTNNETLFKMHYDISSQINDNLKNLILTQKGERLGFPDFGTNMQVLYSDTKLTEDEISNILINEISSTVSKYLPSIRLENFYSEKISVSDNINNPNLTGSNYYNISNKSINFTDIKINNLNKNNKSSGEVYEIKIDYQIPILNTNNNLILYIRTSR